MFRWPAQTAQEMHAGDDKQDDLCRSGSDTPEHAVAEHADDVGAGQGREGEGRAKWSNEEEWDGSEQSASG